MEASNGSPILAWIHRITPRRLNTYTAYSIGCAIAWALLWTILAATGKKETQSHVLLIFLGWCDRLALRHDRPSRLSAP